MSGDEDGGGLLLWLVDLSLTLANSRHRLRGMRNIRSLSMIS